MTIQNPTPPFKQPKACAAGFGRFFYGVDSTVMFSQVLTTSKNAGRCFQVNDPTSDDISDLLDTDGGVIPLDGAVQIQALRVLGSSILVFCKNGVWLIGGSDSGFSATSYTVNKVTEKGIDSVRSIAEVQGAILYFSGSGIVQIGSTEAGFQAQDITESTIRTRYLEDFAGKGAQGAYNPTKKEIQWWTPESNSKGLILDLQASAFYPQENASTVLTGLPVAIDSEYLYPMHDGTKLYFADCTNTLFEDFGVPTVSYLVSGYETLGKFSHSKSVTEAKFYFQKTETQITGYDDSGYIFDKPSSCLFQARWDFDSSNAYKKWVGVTTSDSGSGKPMELYQSMRRGFIPDAFPYTLNTGEGILRKKIQIRGSGEAVQFRFEAQAGKDLQLLGYSVGFSMGGRIR